MELIPEDLVRSICMRVEDYRTLCRCQVVSKRWNSVLTDSQFIQAFATHIRKRHPVPKITFLIENSKIVPNHYDMYYGWDFYQSFYARPQFLELSCDHINTLTQTPPSFLNFLPHPSVRVRASFNDLLLVSSSPVDYYVCNPLTRRWVSLPEAPHTGTSPAEFGLVGRPDATYRVVLFHTGCIVANGREYVYLVSVFSSETRVWTRDVSPSWPILTDEIDPNFCTQKGLGDRVVVCKGALYWRNESPDRILNILRFDPYGNDQRWRKIFRLPSEGFEPFEEVRCFVGERRGRVLFCSVACKPGSMFFEASKLGSSQDSYNKLNWYNIHINHDINVANLDELDIIGLTFHPFDKKIVFFYTANCVLRYDMLLRKLHRVADMPTPAHVATHQLSAFTIVTCPFPTPVS